MKLGEVFAGQNILIHPVLRRGSAVTDACQNFTVRIKNLPQIAEAYGDEGARIAFASLLARAQRELPAGSVISPDGEGRLGVIVWDGSILSDNLPAAGGDDWLNALLADLLLEPVSTDAGPMHLHVVLAQQENESTPGAGPSASTLDLWGDCKDIDYARRAYRADMALLSPVLAALGGFRNRGRQELDVEVCWRPICDANSPETAVFYEAGLGLINTTGQFAVAERELEAAERLGLAHILDEFLVSRAVDELIDAQGGLCLSVSVSEQSLMNGQFWSDAISRLNVGGAIACDLIVEVRGSCTRGAFPGAVEALEQLRRLGCRISIGNFGLGSTSLRDIVAIAPDQVTIDKHLLSSAAHTRFDSSALCHLVGLAQALGAKVVMDGVDSLELASTSRDTGASLFKGEWCGRPRIYRSWAHRTGFGDQHLCTG